MDSTTIFLTGDHKFQGNAYTVNMPDDDIIDPILNTTTDPDQLSLGMSGNTDSRFLTNLNMWNPGTNNQMSSLNTESFNPRTSNMPQPLISSRSSPRNSLSSELSLGSSRTSSKLATPSLLSSTPENVDSKVSKNTKVTQAPRRRSSARNNAKSTGSVPAPPSPATSSRRRSTKAPVMEEEDGEDANDEEMEDGTRRNKFLKRNRIAASKCRQKKKEWVGSLEETKCILENQRSTLESEYNDLVNEVSRMKMQLMNHAACNDPNIDQWIDNEARTFVQKTAAKYQNVGCNGINCCQHRQASMDSKRSIAVKSTEPSTPETVFDHLSDVILDPKASQGAQH